MDPQQLTHLPRSAGVYLFWGDSQLPLYIGKSIDIRARVLSHLRTPDEAKMVAQTRRVDFIPTAGEIGALLLEAQLIKAHQPLFNIRLRRLRNTNSIRLNHNGLGVVPEIVSSKDTAIGQTEGLYGLFSSQRAAQERLRELARDHALCHSLLGLEKLGKRGCFGLQVKACLGACIGLEDRATHDQRLLKSLLEMKIHAWPYAGAIDIVETNGEWTEKHRIHHWRYLGTWCSQSHAIRNYTETAFDMDTYKILVKPIMLGTAQVEGVRS
jgi:excinuclease Cho